MIRLEEANRDLTMDNSNLKAVVKKLERDILSQELENVTAGASEQPRSNSVPIRHKRIHFNEGQSKQHILNPFLRVQKKFEVEGN